MRPLEEAKQPSEELGEFGTSPLQILWVQKLTQDGKVKFTTIPGASNSVDLGAKHLDGGSIRRALERCHCYAREGRCGIALRAEVQEITRPHPEAFTFDDAGELDPQSETDMAFGQ